jgi:Raf kinase inhibitor-like YbhB/YbcL family protein
MRSKSLNMETKTKKILVDSPAFSHNGHIPMQYTCEGENFNPAIEISDLPGDTVSVAIILEDPDVPSGVFTHWLLWNLPAEEHITEKTSLGVSGINDFGKTGYGGPCPPSGTHRYYFKIYALDKELTLAGGENKKSLLEHMDGHIIAVGELVGRYRKRKIKTSL